MKSIVEEASSLAKAFTQAWERAGKPQECTIKILAEPEKNFLGLTTKSAKLAIFFNETAPAQSKKGAAPQPQAKRTPAQQPQPQQRRAQSERQQPQQRQQERPRQEIRQSEQRSQEQRSNEQRSNEPRPSEQRRQQLSPKEVVREITSQEAPKTDAAPRVRPTWNDEMAQGVRSWVQESLQIMGCTEVTFDTNLSRSILTITFSKPVIEDLEKERLLFRSWSHLIVQHIKQECKVHGKELKIILKGSRGQQ